MEQRIETTRSLQAAGDQLCAILTDHDRPAWLVPITNAATQFVNDKSGRASENLIKSLASLGYLVNRKIEINDDTNAKGFDFDALYNERRAEGKLPDLFSQMTEYLSKIIRSGAVDSVAVLGALERLRGSLETNQTASLASTMLAISHATYVADRCFTFLSKIPQIANAVGDLKRRIVEAAEVHDSLLESLRAEAMGRIVGEKDKLEQIHKEAPQPMILDVGPFPGVGGEPKNTDDDHLNGNRQS
jgi:hypothetical protein